MKKIFKLLLKLFLGLIGLLFILFIVLKISFSEDIPSGITGQPADELALKVLKAINHKEFTQASELHWTFAGRNRYEWKLQQDLVDVYWDDYRVSLQTKYPKISFAWKGDEKLKGEAFDNAVATAQANFNNDSFWMIAPHKLFDPGVTRQVIQQDGKQQLLVTYTNGGSTPGDSYLWELDENNQPVAFKMWVSIIPLDGIRATWDDWEMTDCGFPLSRKRNFYGIEIPITDVKVIP